MHTPTVTSFAQGLGAFAAGVCARRGAQWRAISGSCAAPAMPSLQHVANVKAQAIQG